MKERDDPTTPLAEKTNPALPTTTTKHHAKQKATGQVFVSDTEDAKVNENNKDVEAAGYTVMYKLCISRLQCHKRPHHGGSIGVHLAGCLLQAAFRMLQEQHEELEDTLIEPSQESEADSSASHSLQFSHPPYTREWAARLPHSCTQLTLGDAITEGAVATVRTCTGVTHHANDLHELFTAVVRSSRRCPRPTSWRRMDRACNPRPQVEQTQCKRCCRGRKHASCWEDVCNAHHRHGCAAYTLPARSASHSIAAS